MAHWQIVKQDAVEGYNMDGQWQETDAFYLVLKDGAVVYDHDGFFQTLTYLTNAAVAEGDRINLDVTV